MEKWHKKENKHMHNSDEKHLKKGSYGRMGADRR
jgi:hypothetical protein